MSAAILYVDDDLNNLSVLKAICAPELRILTATGAAEAWETLAQEEIAVLLADQRMPQVTGVELLERAAREYPEVIRILITAYSDLDAAIDAINRGQISRYIRKPWDAHDLRATLRQAIETYEIRRQLREMEKRLLATERVYALGVVAASVAHELRSPLTLALNSIDTAETRLKNALKATTRRECDSLIAEALSLLTKAAGAVDRMTEITKGIDLSQRRADQRRLVDMAQIVRLTLASLRSAIKIHGRIETNIHDTKPVLASPNALSQVTLNLVVNALEALPTQSSRQNIVKVRLCDDGEWVRFDVEDTGPGIATEDLERIFDPFFTTKPEGGTGLGLAISMRIVKEIGGSIEVRSEPNKGSRFSVRLPAAH
jgi:two-component system NtrC family sensor kinase